MWMPLELNEQYNRCKLLHILLQTRVSKKAGETSIFQYIVMHFHILNIKKDYYNTRLH